MIEILVYILIMFVALPYVLSWDGERKGVLAGLKTMVMVHVIFIILIVIIGPFLLIVHFLTNEG